MTATAQRTAAAQAAREKAVAAKILSIEKTLKQHAREGTPVTAAGVARRAGVSRTFVYQNATARALLSAALPVNGHQPLTATTAGDESTWQQRALNAETHIKRLTDEIHLQRARLAEYLGQIRDLEADLPADGIERLRHENRTLRQGNTELTRDNRRLQERLSAARDNIRFLDRRTAQLEAQLLELEPPAEQRSEC